MKPEAPRWMKLVRAGLVAIAGDAAKELTAAREALIAAEKAMHDAITHDAQVRNELAEFDKKHAKFL